MPGPRAFPDLHALARRVSRRADEADDLVQEALLVALESGRTNLASPETRRWLAGVIRNRAAFDARTSVRRRRRETGWSEAQPAAAIRTEAPAPELAHLSPALRVTALLGPTRRPEAFLASHDPDGHLFVVSRSQISTPRQQTRG